MTSGRTERTTEAEDELLVAIQETGSVTAACRRTGIGRSTAYEWKAADPDFAARMEAAQDRGTDALEDEATRRAVEGVDEPVFYQGEVAGYVRRYSDTLLMFTLKGRRPEKWKDRTSTELTGANGGPVQVENVREELARRIARLSAATPAGGNSGGADGS